MSMCGGGREGERGLTRIFRAKRRLVSCAFMTRRETQTTHEGRDTGRRRGGQTSGWRIYTGYETGIPMLSILLCASSVSVSTQSVGRSDPFISFSLGEIAFTRLHSIPFPSFPSRDVISGEGRKNSRCEKYKRASKKRDGAAA